MHFLRKNKSGGSAKVTSTQRIGGSSWVFFALLLHPSLTTQGTRGSSGHFTTGPGRHRLTNSPQSAV